MRTEPVLVTGSTGYVGGRLTPMLLQAGHRVRALARSRAKLAGRPWADHPNLEVVKGDLFDLDSMEKAVRGCWAAFYLVHSMNPATKDFARADRVAAGNMAASAASEGLERIIYLGGLIPRQERPSHHLASRAEVGRILKEGPVPVTWLRAAMILGSGSASFELMRYLVDRLPLMLTPRWVRSEVQPISITNVLEYLVGCLDHAETAGQTFDICGPDILTYEDLFQIYAEEAGLPRRRIIRIPVLTPRLSSYWIHLVTPIHSSLARLLAEGLRNTVVCGENRIRDLIPQELLDCRGVVREILQKRQNQAAETCWMDAGPLRPPEWIQPGDASYAGGTILQEAYRIRLAAARDQIWPHLERIGGGTGYYSAGLLWRSRGWLDKLAGGIGAGRGRRHPTDLRAGDVVDTWRVLEIKPNRRLLLLAEMKTPGEALLDFHLLPAETGGTELQMVGRFLPKGLLGLVYWSALRPFHRLVYKGFLRGIAAAAGTPVRGGPEPYSPKNEDLCLLDKD